METLKTAKGKNVIAGKLYELKFKWAQGYHYGYGWLNPKRLIEANVDIICNDGGVTIQHVQNVIFIRQITNK